jgi:hypothetical protein
MELKNLTELLHKFETTLQVMSLTFLLDESRSECSSPTNDGLNCIQVKKERFYCRRCKCVRLLNDLDDIMFKRDEIMRNILSMEEELRKEKMLVKLKPGVVKNDKLGRDNKSESSNSGQQGLSDR